MVSKKKKKTPHQQYTTEKNILIYPKMACKKKNGKYFF